MTDTICTIDCENFVHGPDDPRGKGECKCFGVPVTVGCLCLERFEYFTPIDKAKTVDNQKVKADNGKPKLTLVPRKILEAIARVREYGNNKYPEGGPDTWKQVSIERYREATFRHLIAYLDNPSGVDEESGLPHLWHLACNVAFLCELESEKTTKEDTNDASEH